MPGLAFALTDKERTKKDAIEGPLNILTWLGGTASFLDTNFKIETKNIAGNRGIYGHTIFGIYGTSRYGIGSQSALIWGAGNWNEKVWDSATKSFVLGHSIYGQLGLNTLGATTADWYDLYEATGDQQLTTTGRAGIAQWLATGSNAFPQYLRLGSGSASYLISNSALGAEDTDLSQWTSTPTGFGLRTFQHQFEMNSLVSGDAYEFGVFSATGSGIMTDRRVIATGLTKTNAEEWRVTYTLSGSNSVPMMDTGMNAIRDWLASGTAGATYPQYMSWGSGSSAVSITDTGMDTIHSTNIFDTTSADGTVAKFEGTLLDTQATGLIVNRLGIWSASGSGTLYMHGATPDISKDNTFQVQTFAQTRVE